MKRYPSGTMPGLRPCPHCNGGQRRPCAYACMDGFVNVDRTGETYLLWLKEQMGTKDTDPDLGPVTDREEKNK